MDKNLNTPRIQFLDSLRGISILFVIMFHAYARWPEIVPYGNKFSSFFIFKNGYLGVQLFFLISGFVILMTLERCSNYVEFLYKRWLRLFPAMFFVNIFIFVTSNFLWERPAGIPEFSSIIPGITFLHPSWIKLISGFSLKAIEGAFWSLFVEIHFYLIFGLLFFLFGKDLSILGLILLYLINFLSSYFNVHFLIKISSYFSFEHFGWFAIGALLFRYYTSKNKNFLLQSLLVSILVSIISYFNNKDSIYFIILIFLLFYLPIYFQGIQTYFQIKFLSWLGVISYPLYLIHENAMIAMIVKLHRYCEYIPDLLLPILPIIILIFIAQIIYSKIEPFIKSMIIRVKNKF